MTRRTPSPEKRHRDGPDDESKRERLEAIKDDWKDIENDGKGQKYENDPREALFRLPDENDWKWSKMTGTTGRGQNTGTTRRHFESDWTLTPAILGHVVEL